MKMCSFLSLYFYGVFIILERLLGRLWRRLEDNITMKIKEQFGETEGFHLAQEGIRGGLMLTR